LPNAGCDSQSSKSMSIVGWGLDTVCAVEDKPAVCFVGSIYPSHRMHQVVRTVVVQDLYTVMGRPIPGACVIAQIHPLKHDPIDIRAQARLTDAAWSEPRRPIGPRRALCFCRDDRHGGGRQADAWLPRRSSSR
jgi:hypothetical protein